jgi:MoaA/NifB/PqqE/SkfB family radical SAM enzyme
MKKLTKIIDYVKILQYPKEYKQQLFNQMLSLVTLFITYRCNSKCKTCELWKTPQNERSKEITLENIKKLFSSSVLKNLKEVYLTGGEPLLRKDLQQIITTIHQLLPNTIISFTTNGLMVQKTESLMKMLVKKKIPHYVTFSLNGLQEVHDFSRGVPGNFQRINKLLDSAKSLGVRCGVVYTAFPFNYKELLKTYRYIKYEKRLPFYISFGRYDLRYNLHNKEHKLIKWNKNNVKELERILRKIISFDKQYIPVYLYVKKLSTNWNTRFKCTSLLQRIYIDPYGIVFACDSLNESVKIGDLSKCDFNFDEFINKHYSRLTEVWDIIYAKKCQPCWISCDLVASIENTLSLKSKLSLIFSKLKNKISRF